MASFSLCGNLSNEKSSLARPLDSLLEFPQSDAQVALQQCLILLIVV